MSRALAASTSDSRASRSRATLRSAWLLTSADSRARVRDASLAAAPWAWRSVAVVVMAPLALPLAFAAVALQPDDAAAGEAHDEPRLRLLAGPHPQLERAQSLAVLSDLRFDRLRFERIEAGLGVATGGHAGHFHQRVQLPLVTLEDSPKSADHIRPARRPGRLIGRRYLWRRCQRVFFSALRCLCLLIFLRRFLMTEPICPP